MFVCTGILSNHDSPLRPLRFVTRKIIHAVASLAVGRETKLSLGNFEVERDWGWAPDMSKQLRRCCNKLRLRTTSSPRARTTRPTDIDRNKVNPAKAAVGLGRTGVEGGT
jgi:GDPmannose 4,6-dehydratase